MSLEKILIEQCAPTLAGIKTASLFPIKAANKRLLKSQIAQWNIFLKNKGVQLCILKEQKETSLLYVYRTDSLEKDLHTQEAQYILSGCGYNKTASKQAIRKLKTRFYDCAEFPHEIGLFLGYPPSDVLGFINHKGKNCHLCGYWKVYESPEKAKRTFELFDKCKKVYKRLWAEGTDIMQLTVA